MTKFINLHYSGLHDILFLLCVGTNYVCVFPVSKITMTRASNGYVSPGLSLEKISPGEVVALCDRDCTPLPMTTVAIKSYFFHTASRNTAFFLLFFCSFI